MRLLRTAVFTAVCVVLSAAGTWLAAGAGVPGWTLVAGFAGVFAVAAPLAGRERTLPGHARPRGRAGRPARPLRTRAARSCRPPRRSRGRLADPVRRRAGVRRGTGAAERRRGPPHRDHARAWTPRPSPGPRTSRPERQPRRTPPSGPRGPGHADVRAAQPCPCSWGTCSPRSPPAGCCAAARSHSSGWPGSRPRAAGSSRPRPGCAHCGRPWHSYAHCVRDSRAAHDRAAPSRTPSTLPRRPPGTLCSTW